MADIDLLPPRGVPRLALVDGLGIATNGSQTVLQLAQRGMQAVCAVDGSGVSADGATMLQLAQRGIRAFCPVDELGVAQSGATADALRRAGIRPMVLLGATGVALTGSATMLTLAQRGLSYFCPVDEAGNATTMGAVILVTNTNVLETATIGTNVGVLSVAGGTGTYTFSLTDSAGGKFAVAGTNGVNLNVAAALDYETATSHNITVSATNGGTPITRTIAITVVNVVEDTTPNAFTFTDVTGAALSTLTESNAITVAGIDGPATMTITGGEYQINGGSWASTSTTVVATNTVKVRRTSSASPTTAVDVTLTIGGVSDTFTITTVAGGGGTLDAPSIDLVSAGNDNRPDFDVGIPISSLAGDILKIQADGGSGYADYLTYPLTSGDLGSGTINVSGVPPLPDGSYTYRARMERGSDISAWSVTDSGVIDTTGPTITTPSTANNNEGTLLSIALTANEAVTWAETLDTGNNFEISVTTLRWTGNGVKAFTGVVDAYSCDVRATDAAGNQTTQTITVTVVDVIGGTRSFGAEGMGIVGTTGSREWSAEGVSFVES